MATSRICSIEGCDKKHKGHGLCQKHLQRLRKNGSTDALIPSIVLFLNHLFQNSTDECIIWPFARNNRGYAMMTLYVDNVRYNLPHRYVCEKLNGPPPTEDYQAAHTCGRGSDGCVNPKHTVWKTQIENEYDKRIHDTLLFGERAPWSKITEIEASIIKHSNLTPNQLTEMFPITKKSISDIRCGRTWKHLT